MRPKAPATLEAARAEAESLERLLGRRVRFVHPLPAGTDAGALRRLGGGAGFDLDSLLTVLPTNGRPVALLGRVVDGADLLGSVDAAELDTFAATYDLAPRGAALRAALTTAQATPRARALDTFLDVVDAHLGRSGFTVERIPLLLVPYVLRTDPEAIPGHDFLVGWNNVVLETGEGKQRAEGFGRPTPYR